MVGRSLRLPLLAVSLAAVLAAACAKAPELSREAAGDLIAHAPAFEGPWDPGIQFVDSQRMVMTSDVQRRLLRVESVVLRPDALGLAGTTATAVFTWRWQNGPLAGMDFRSTAKLHCARGVWKVYNDKLQEDLWRAERGQD
jgi:hypothetical protein